MQWHILFPEDGALVGDKATRLAAVLPPSLPEPPHSDEDTIDDEELRPATWEVSSRPVRRSPLTLLTRCFHLHVREQFGHGPDAESEWEGEEDADPDDRGCAPQ